MLLPFKITTAPVPSVPKVGDTNFKDHYYGVNASMLWEQFELGIRKAVQHNLLPYLGRAWYDAVMAKYHNTPGDLSPDEAQALEYLRDAAANYAVAIILPANTAMLSTLGTVQQSPEGGAVQSPQWAWTAKLNDAVAMADAALDLLLAHMEKRVQAEDADFDLWKQAPEYNYKTADFIRLASELDEYLNIKSSRRTFISIVPFIRQVERHVIKPLLCADLYTALLDIDNELSAVNKKLLPLIQEAAVYLGAYTAIPHHRINVEADGFRVVSFTDQYTDRRNLTNNVHEAAVQALMQRCQEQGDAAIRELKNFLEENLNDYPLYRDSSCRSVPATKAHSIIQSPDQIGAILL